MSQKQETFWRWSTRTFTTGELPSEQHHHVSRVAVTCHNITSGQNGYRCGINYKDKDKGKAIPLQAWTGLEGSRRLKLPDFKTIGT